MTAFDGWENFYVIVGSSAGALIGLQFVVMTLLADMPIAGSDAQAGQAFGTPNVVHFGVVLLLSAIIVAPWNGIGIVAVLWGLVGVSGMVYAVVVARRMRSQTIYHAVFEDWRRSTALTLHRHSQRLGHGDVPRVREQAATAGAGGRSRWRATHDRRADRKAHRRATPGPKGKRIGE
jgi:hypothetical protein